MSLTLPAIVAEEAALLDRFADLLRLEQQSLQSGKPDNLQEIVIQKAPLVDRLNQLGGQRNTVLERAGLPPDRPGMDAWLAQQAPDTRITHEWQRVLDLARTVRALNQLNGQLLALQLQNTQEALAVLNQQAQQSALYGSDGQSSPLTAYRIIDSA